MQQIDTSKTYVLAVSGGVDSMVMLHMFATTHKSAKFSVVTINHNLRKEALSDCQFVQDFCQTLGVPCQTISVDVVGFCQQNKLSVETGARILRYQVFESLPCDFVCLAHHADDNAESVLMHLLRGSGANGVQGMQRQKGKYLRPMLCFGRQQIVSYAKQHGVPHVEDSTNACNNHARNAIRNQVFPLLQSIYPGAKTNLLRFADSIKQDSDFLDGLADVSAVRFDGNQAQIPIELLVQPRPLAVRVLQKVFATMGYTHDVEKVHLDDVLALAKNNGGKKICLPFGLVAVNDYNSICIFEENGRDVPSFSMPFAVGTTQTPVGLVDVSTSKTQGALTFDLAKIPQTAVFRTPQSGDVFTKFGGGTKPLNKYLIDKKIRQRQRQNLVVVADGNNVLIVCGVEISNQVKTDQTSQTYYIKQQGEQGNATQQ